MAEEIPTEELAETENYAVWLSQEPDGEITYHIELGGVTVHFFDEEWREFLQLIGSIPTDTSDSSSSNSNRTPGKANTKRR